MIPGQKSRRTAVCAAARVRVCLPQRCNHPGLQPVPRRRADRGMAGRKADQAGGIVGVHGFERVRNLLGRPALAGQLAPPRAGRHPPAISLHCRPLRLQRARYPAPPSCAQSGRAGCACPPQREWQQRRKDDWIASNPPPKPEPFRVTARNRDAANSVVKPCNAAVTPHSTQRNLQRGRSVPQNYREGWSMIDVPQIRGLVLSHDPTDRH